MERLKSDFQVSMESLRTELSSESSVSSELRAKCESLEKVCKEYAQKDEMKTESSEKENI